MMFCPMSATLYYLFTCLTNTIIPFIILYELRHLLPCVPFLAQKIVHPLNTPDQIDFATFSLQ